jgi:hypothetical protein
MVRKTFKVSFEVPDDNVYDNESYMQKLYVAIADDEDLGMFEVQALTVRPLLERQTAHGTMWQ